MRHLKSGLFLALGLLSGFLMFGQCSKPVAPVICYAHHQAHPIQVPAPLVALRGTQTANFEVEFVGDIPSAASRAFEFTVGIWGSLLESSVPIQVRVRWDTLADNVLGSAGPSTAYTQFQVDGSPREWYPVALAEALADRSLNGPDEIDINVTINSRINWYFGTDLRPGTRQFDFVTVMLHELAHGLAFFSPADAEGDTLTLGFDGRLFIYETYFRDLRGQSLIPSQGDPSKVALRLFTSDSLAFDCPEIARSQGRNPRLFAPSNFDVASSLSHLDESTYPPSNPNALMTPQLALREANHDPGPEALCIFARQGWRVNRATTHLAGAGPATPKIHPNPTRDWVNLTVPVGTKGWVWTVSDLTGRKVSQQKGGRRLSVAALPRGVYHLRGQGPDRTPYQWRLVKQ